MRQASSDSNPCLTASFRSRELAPSVRFCQASTRAVGQVRRPRRSGRRPLSDIPAARPCLSPWPVRPSATACCSAHPHRRTRAARCDRQQSPCDRAGTRSAPRTGASLPRCARSCRASPAPWLRVTVEPPSACRISQPSSPAYSPCFATGWQSAGCRFQPFRPHELASRSQGSPEEGRDCSLS